MHRIFPDIPLPHLTVGVSGHHRSYHLAENLKDFSIPETIFHLENNKPPAEWGITEDEWEHGINLCLQARVKGRWYGDDILHPIPMTDDMVKFIEKWESECSKQ